MLAHYTRALHRRWPGMGVVCVAQNGHDTSNTRALHRRWPGMGVQRGGLLTYRDSERGDRAALVFFVPISLHGARP